MMLLSLVITSLLDICELAHFLFSIFYCAVTDYIISNLCGHGLI